MVYLVKSFISAREHEENERTQHLVFERIYGRYLWALGLVAGSCRPKLHRLALRASHTGSFLTEAACKRKLDLGTVDCGPLRAKQERLVYYLHPTGLKWVRNEQSDRLAIPATAMYPSLTTSSLAR